MRTSFADVDKGGWYGQSWTETIFVLDLSVLDPADGMVTATEEKVLLWGVRRQGAKIDEDDSYGSFDHSYKCKDILDPRSEHIKLMFSCVIYPLLDVEGVPVSVYPSPSRLDDRY